jgi:adenylate kinase
MSVTKNSPKRPAILMLGAPGAGKGTQGKILGTIPRFIHFACGDAFRSLDTRTPIGQKFIEYSSRGELVPDELTVSLWKTQIDNLADMHVYKPDIDCLVLDGIPRNVRQAELINTHVDIHLIIHLSCPNRAELARRMRKRALKENRLDDASETVIQQRISTYEEETKPILDYYPDELILDVDATQPPIKVFHQITSRIITLPLYERMASQQV